MGIIDQKCFTVACPTCGSSESATISDKGSGWSGSSWGSHTQLKKFDAIWEGGGKSEPEIKTATCKSCGTTANVESRYTT